VNEPLLTLAQFTAARTMVVDQTTLEVTGALRGAGVRALVMKGPVFTELLFDPSEVREYRDTDVLVAPDGLDRAGEVLRGLGFTTLPTAEIAAKHAQIWGRGRAEVDLHREIWGARVPAARVWEVLTRDTRRMRVGDGTVETYSRAAALAHVALHAAQHMGTDLKVVDEMQRAAVRAAFADWEAAREVAVELDAEAAFAAGLRRAAAGADVARRLGLPERVPVDVQLGAERRPGTIRYLHRLRRTPGTRAKLALLPGAVLPSREWMRTKPLARRGRRGLAAAYGLRLARGAARIIPSLLTLWRMRRKAL
jgi:hypothetical protein